MPELINCKKCGTLFRKKLRNICDKCLNEENSNINKINKVLEACRENYVSLEEISEKTGVNFKEVEELYKTGRLLANSEKIATKCKICGVITTPLNKKGNFCTKCYQQQVKDEDSKKPSDNSEDQIELRKFEKDIMHTNKEISEKDRLKYGFKKSYD